MTPSLESRIRIFVGDITTLEVDAIVTAANEQLRGGGGVDGAVHAAAGPQLVRASRELAPCPAGSAKITPAFNLKVHYVIHAVGPVFRDLATDANVLASAYQSSLALAVEHDLARVALPCISTGVYGFPAEAACQIAIETVVASLRRNDLPRVVTFCCFGDQDAKLYRRRLDELGISLA
jgi:O-acetyl-ADP-ribose deacetylase (regulator of RNase III)